MRQFLRAGGTDVVIAYAVDRLSRNQNQIGVVFDEIQQAGARLDFVTERFEDTAVGRFILAARAFVTPTTSPLGCHTAATESGIRGYGSRCSPSDRTPDHRRAADALLTSVGPGRKLDGDALLFRIVGGKIRAG